MDAPERGLRGISLRTFDSASGEWAIYWWNPAAHGALEPPVVGRFVDGIGDFFDDEDYQGVPNRVRYRWSGITATSAHWEQAFSTDEGKTW